MGSSRASRRRSRISASRRKKKPDTLIKLEYGELPEENQAPEVKFHPPETITEEGDGAVEDASNSDWDKAIHYHEIKRRLDELRREKVRAAAIRAIVRRAQAAVGSISRPYELKNAPWHQHPQDEFDLDASLEEDPTLENPWWSGRNPAGPR